jgi:excisionase family DNA binding protein
MEDLLKEYPAVLSISDVAAILNITPATVRRHIKKRDIPSIKVGRLVRVPKDSLISYLHGEVISRPDL